MRPLWAVLLGFCIGLAITSFVGFNLYMCFGTDL